jgi:outer membrane protein OmpA-like peptidoglycan-associated protein
MRFFSISLIVLALAGCASNSQVKTTEEDPRSHRIFYKDLSVREESLKVHPMVSEPKLNNETDGLGMISLSAPFFIAFENESFEALPAKKNVGLSALLRDLDAQASYIIVGYSHGYSAAGTRNLAEARSDHVAKLLASNGVPLSNLHLMASSSNSEDAALVVGKSYPPITFPAFGAHVFKLLK